MCESGCPKLCAGHPALLSLLLPCSMKEWLRSVAVQMDKQVDGPGRKMGQEMNQEGDGPGKAWT